MMKLYVESLNHFHCPQLLKSRVCAITCFLNNNSIFHGLLYHNKVSSGSQGGSTDKCCGVILPLIRKSISGLEVIESLVKNTYLKAMLPYFSRVRNLSGMCKV